MGNLFSVLRACRTVGLEAVLSEDPEQVLRSDALILPGVGSMPEAMASLKESGLAEAISEAAGRGTPLFGICLGMQLLMESGSEFDDHLGLGLVPGEVVRLEGSDELGDPLRVPHIGWSGLHVDPSALQSPLARAILPGLGNVGPYYFVHSFYVRPANPEVVAARTRYGSMEFCSSLAVDNIFGCQFHPETSGSAGLDMYRGFKAHLTS